MASSVEPFQQFYEQQSVAIINDEAIDNFANKFIADHMDNYKQKTSALQLPLNFSEEAEEINFISILHLLGVGGNYDHRVVKACERPMSEVVLFGIFGAYIGQNRLDALFMRSQTASDIGIVLK